MELRALDPSEIGAFDRAIVGAFHNDLADEDAALYAKLHAPERTLVWVDGGRIVGGSASFRRELTVPGGTVPAAAVTGVGVQPTHRRRGLLTALMRRQLDELHERFGDPVAILWASEAAIYPRFGYGLATWAARLRVRTETARLRADLDVSAGPDEVRAPSDVIDALRERHERVRVERAGMLDRPAAWWDATLHDPERRRAGASALRAVLVEDGYALYAVRSSDAHRETVVRELVAATAPGAVALWAFLLGLDLVSGLVCERAASDEPLPHALAHADAAELTLMPGLWLRLVDVGAALAARRLDPAADVVVGVSDAYCPWNEARFTLDGSRTAAAPDLVLDAEALAAAYLGGTAVTALAAAGRVEERMPGAAAAMARALAAPRAPWCPDHF